MNRAHPQRVNTLAKLVLLNSKKGYLQSQDVVEMLLGIHEELSSTEHIEEPSTDQIVQEPTVLLDDRKVEVTGDHHHTIQAIKELVSSWDILRLFRGLLLSWEGELKFLT
jgi:hypothetical protein